MRKRVLARVSAVLLSAVFPSTRSIAQQAPVATAADYARAESFLRDKVIPLVSGMGVEPIWLSDGRLGYRIPVRGASQFVLVDPARGSRLACSPETDRCGGAIDERELARIRQPTRLTAARAEVASPDGKRAAFIRSYNLWVCDIGS